MHYRLPDLFLRFTEEDGLLEWLTVLGYLVAAIVFAGLAINSLRKREPVVWFLILLTLGCIFVAGEEISWGQRLFGLKTPELLAEVNYQNELTLHNIGEFGKDWPRRIYIYGTFLYFVLLPPLHSRSRWIKQTIERLGLIVPPSILVVPFCCSIAFAVLTKLHGLFGIALPAHHEYTTEVMEFFSGLLFFHFALLQLAQFRRLKSNAASSGS